MDRKVFILLLLFANIYMFLYLNDLSFSTVGSVRVYENGNNKFAITNEGKFLLRDRNLKIGEYESKYKIVPFDKRREIYGFSKNDYYKSKFFRGEILLDSPELINEFDKSFREKFREFSTSRLSKYGRYSGLVYSLLFGSKDIDRGDKDLFKRFSLLHLFVVSGLHISIYVKSINSVLKKIRIPRLIRDSLILALLSFLLYQGNFHVSTMRAILMFIFSEAIVFLKIKIDPIEKLSIISIVLLIINPYNATSFSFILGTLAYGSLTISKNFSIFKLFLILMPIQLLFYPYISPVYLLVNIIVTMSMRYILPFIMISYVFTPLIVIISNFFYGLISVLKYIDRFTLAIKVTPFYWFSISIFYCMVILYQISKENKKFHLLFLNKYLIVLFIIIFSIIVRLEHSYFRKGIHFIDVGQGDCSVIITEHNKKILIDTGNRKSTIKMFDYLGIDYFDAVFISHLDDDHCGLIEDLKYRKLYTPKSYSIRDSIQLSKGDVINIDDVSIRIISPDRITRSKNNDSLVFYLEAYGFKVLYTGDIDSSVMDKILLEDVDILKFPHHGSKLSLNKEKIIKISPEISVISCGNNNYSHPHREVIDFLNEKSIETFITKYSGSFKFIYGRVYNY